MKQSIAKLLVYGFAITIGLTSCSKDDDNDNNPAKGGTDAVACTELEGKFIKSYTGDATFSGVPETGVTATLSSDGTENGCPTYKITFDTSDMSVTGIRFIESTGKSSYASANQDQGVGINNSEESFGVHNGTIIFGSNNGDTPPSDGGGTTTPPCRHPWAIKITDNLLLEA